KAIARPPDAIRKPLQRIAEDIRRRAREVFVHRGNYGRRTAAPEISRIWAVNPQGSRRRYVIRRDHELVAILRRQLGDDKGGLLDGLLDLIEQTVPVDRVWLDVTEHGVPTADVDAGEAVDAAASICRLL